MINGHVSVPAPVGGEWFTSSRSNAGGSCIEVKFASGATLVRDSKDRRGGQPVLDIPAEGWGSFLNTITGR